MSSDLTHPHAGYQAGQIVPASASDLNHRDRIYHGTGRPTDLDRQRDEEELVDPVARQLLEIQAFHDVDALLNQEQGVYGLRVAGDPAIVGRCGLHFEGLGVRTAGDDPAVREPSSRGQIGSRSPMLLELRHVRPVGEVSGADERDIATLEFNIAAPGYRP